MTREIAASTKRIGAALLCAALLHPAGPAAARTSEAGAPASAWWAAADMALARGDCARALAILEEQVTEHHYGAVARLGDIHESGQCAELGLPPAPELYERLIADGTEVAKARLGYLYLEGLGVPRDVARARRLFKEAVLELVAHAFPQDRRAAMRGVMSRHGLPRELEAELDWADRIEAGPPRVQYETALRLRDGAGLPRHEDAAYDWLRKAAHRGVPDAWFERGMWDLARACHQGDRRDALWRIAHAATLGHVPAIKEMGLRMAEARGIERYDFGAMVLLLKAHWAGEDVAATLLEVASRLNVHEKAVAVDLALQGDYIVTFGLAPPEAQPQPSADLSCSKSPLSSKQYLESLIPDLEFLNGVFKPIGQVICVSLCTYERRYVRDHPARELTQHRHDGESGPNRERRRNSGGNRRDRQLTVESGIETSGFLAEGYDGRVRSLEIFGGFVGLDLEVIEPYPVLNAYHLAPARIGVFAAEALVLKRLDGLAIGIDDAIDLEITPTLNVLNRAQERSAEQPGRRGPAAEVAIAGLLEQSLDSSNVATLVRLLGTDRLIESKPAPLGEKPCAVAQENVRATADDRLVVAGAG